MQDDFPGADRLMCELLISKWCEDPDYFDKLKSGEIKLQPPAEKNTNYVYQGVTVDPVKENGATATIEEEE